MIQEEMTTSVEEVLVASLLPNGGTIPKHRNSFQFSLNAKAISRILHSSGNEIDRLKAVGCVKHFEKALWQIYCLGIYPSRKAAASKGHLQKLIKSLRKFESLLISSESEDIMRAERSSFPNLRSELKTLLFLLQMSDNTALTKKEVNWFFAQRGGSPLELFIRENLTELYVDLFGEMPKLKRQKDGAVDGAFIRFARTFFDEISMDVAAETIARALRRRRPAQVRS